MSPAKTKPQLAMEIEEEVHSSDSLGHCAFEPGTPEWKMYQRERRLSLKQMKEDRENRQIVMEQMKKIERKIRFREGESPNTKKNDEQSNPIGSEILGSGKPSRKQSKSSTYHSVNPKAKTEKKSPKPKTVQKKQSGTGTKTKVGTGTAGMKKTSSGSYSSSESKSLKPKTSTKMTPTKSTKLSQKLMLDKPSTSYKNEIQSKKSPAIPQQTKTKTAMKKSQQSANNLVRHLNTGPSETISSIILSSAPATLVTTDRPIPDLVSLGETNKTKNFVLSKTNSGTSSPSGSQSKQGRSIKPPPQFNLPTCTAFPGTKEWDDYWKQFNSSVQEYQKDMAEYEQSLNQHFSDDLEFFRQRLEKSNQEQNIVKELGVQAGLNFGIVPPLINKSLEGLQVLNGYVIKSKNLKGTVSSIPGSSTGVRIEIQIPGIDPDTILTQREYNFLTMSISNNKFLRIGTPNGKTANDIEIWPSIEGVIIMDCP